MFEKLPILLRIGNFHFATNEKIKAEACKLNHERSYCSI